MERDLDCLRNRRLASVLCAVFLFAAAVIHAHTPGAIAGKVVDRHSNPMGGVTVTAAAAVSGAEKHSMTDASGRYSIEPLPPARYILRAEAESYGCIIVPEVIVDDGQRPAGFPLHWRRGARGMRARSVEKRRQESTQAVSPRPECALSLMFAQAASAQPNSFSSSLLARSPAVSLRL